MNQRNDQDEPGNLLRELENLQRVLDDAASDQVDHGRNIPTLDPVDDIPLLSELFSENDIPVLKAVTAKAAAVPLQPTADNRRAETKPAEAKQTEDKTTDNKPQPASARPVLRAQPLPDVVIQRPHGDQPAQRAQVSAAPVATATTNTEPAATDALLAAAELTPAPARVSANPFLPQAILDRLTQEREAAQHSAQEAHRTMQKVMEQKQARASEQAVQQHMQQLTKLQKEHLIDQLVAEMLPQLTERLREKLREKLNH